MLCTVALKLVWMCVTCVCSLFQVIKHLNLLNIHVSTNKNVWLTKMFSCMKSCHVGCSSYVMSASYCMSPSDQLLYINAYLLLLFMLLFTGVVSCGLSDQLFLFAVCSLECTRCSEVGVMQVFLYTSVWTWVHKAGSRLCWLMMETFVVVPYGELAWVWKCHSWLWPVLDYSKHVLIVLYAVLM